jgi:predicted DNA-binding protein
MTTVRLPPEVLARIDVLVGKQRRAVFIREAVEAELARRQSLDTDPRDPPARR